MQLKHENARAVSPDHVSYDPIRLASPTGAMVTQVSHLVVDYSKRDRGRFGTGYDQRIHWLG
jgi:hypothetical protein